MRERFIVYETEDGPKRKELTAGVAQGLILSPDLWNAFYDEIFRFEMPEGCFLIEFADDVTTAVILTRDVDAAQMRLGQVMSWVRRRMLERELELALTKTEIVLLTKKRISRLFPVQVGEVSAGTKAAIIFPRGDSRYEAHLLGSDTIGGGQGGQSDSVSKPDDGQHWGHSSLREMFVAMYR